MKLISFKDLIQLDDEGKQYIQRISRSWPAQTITEHVLYNIYQLMKSPLESLLIFFLNTHEIEEVKREIERQNNLENKEGEVKGQFAPKWSTFKKSY